MDGRHTPGSSGEKGKGKAPVRPQQTPARPGTVAGRLPGSSSGSGSAPRTPDGPRHPAGSSQPHHSPFFVCEHYKRVHGFVTRLKKNREERTSAGASLDKLLSGAKDARDMVNIMGDVINAGQEVSSLVSLLAENSMELLCELVEHGIADFGRTGMTLIQIVSSGAFASSTNRGSVKLIMERILSESLFLKFASQYAAENIESAAPVVKIFSLLVRCIPEAAADRHFVDAVRFLFEKVLPRCQGQGHLDLRRDIHRLGLFVQAERDVQKVLEESKKDTLFRLSDRLALSLQLEEEVPLEEEPGPGEAHPDGPRHDNDHACYRDISVLPTEQETMCNVNPYLPPGLQGSRHVSHHVERYLDIQFRLLREELLQDVRCSVRTFFEQDGLSTMGSSKWKYTANPLLQDGSAGEQKVRLFCMRHVKFEDVVPHLYSGIAFELSFDHPLLLDAAGSSSGSKAKEEKRNRPTAAKFWKESQGTRIFDRGSLIVFAIGVVASGGPPPTVASVGSSSQHQHQTAASLGSSFSKILFCSVNTLVEKTLGDRRVHVCICFTEPKDLEFLARYLSGKIQDRGRGEDLLLQVKGHFWVGSAPFLEALKAKTAAQLPFEDSIFTTNPTDAPTFMEQQTVPAVWSGCNLDMSNLLKQGSRIGQLTCPIGSFQEMERFLLAFQSEIILDRSQISAFAAAFTRKLCLIQGPPGTGKTFVGVKIVKAMLDNDKRARPREPVMGRSFAVRTSGQDQSSLGPIFCVCFTNHALDQFLEGCISDGVDAESVVRLGSRSKSEVLSSRSLHGVLLHYKTKTDAAETRAIKNAAAELENKISQISSLTTSNICLPIMWKYLASHCPEIAGAIRSIVGPGNDDFTYSGGETKLLEDWLKCKVEVASYVPETGRGGDVDGSADGSEDDTYSEDDNPRRQIDGSDDSFDEAETNDGRSKVDGIWRLSKEQRRDLFNEWSQSCRQQLLAGFPDLVKRYQDLFTRLEDIRNAWVLRACSKAKIVGMTTSGAAKYQEALQALRPRVVICEEAGEVLEAHTIAAVSSATDQLILIGDHQQLRPKLLTYSLRKESGRRFDFDVSLFERLATAEAVQKSMVTLTTQRRMRPEIADLIRNYLYPMLEDHESVYRYPPTRGMPDGCNVWFFDHNFRESGQDHFSSSYRNEFEADMVVQLVKQFVRLGYAKEDIAVLTPYLGQLMLIRSKLSSQQIKLALSDRDKRDLKATISVEDPEKAEGSDMADEDDMDSDVIEKMEELLEDSNWSPSKKTKRLVPSSATFKLKDRVRLATVDNFQGEEAAVVLVSTVRCNSQERKGFLKIDNRINVMVSRAKHAMIMLGSARTILAGSGTNQAKMFKSVLQTLAARRRVAGYIPFVCERHKEYLVHVAEPSDFTRLLPDGGCQLPCGRRMACGHMCLRLCHPDDPNHEAFECKEECGLMLACGHPCPALCFQDCGGCQVPISVRLPDCGHMMTLSCQRHCDPFFSVQKMNCSAMVRLTMPFCRHQVERPCHYAKAVQAHEPHTLYSCSEICGLPHADCGHMCTRKCGDCYRARSSAGTGLGIDVPAGHGTSPVHAGPCQQRCERPLVCGHQCGMPCHPQGQCPPCTSSCSVACVHSSCALKCPRPCAVCAEPCTWTCPHQGLCPVPCGIPCLRLPCNHQCVKKLQCGHQCPGLCGESCISSAVFCQECASDGQEIVIVDLVEMTTLADVDVSVDPLIQLGCGHVFCTSTLDGICEMDLAYERQRDRDPEASLVQWIDYRPLADLSAHSPAPCCPTCRQPLDSKSVKRYGRLLKQRTIELTQRKAIVEESQMLSRFSADADFTSARALLQEVDQKIRVYLSKEHPLKRLSLRHAAAIDRLSCDYFSPAILLPFQPSQQPLLILDSVKLQCLLRLLFLGLCNVPENKKRNTKLKGKGKEPQRPENRVSRSAELLKSVDSLFQQAIIDAGRTRAFATVESLACIVLEGLGRALATLTEGAGESSSTLEDLAELHDMLVEHVRRYLSRSSEWSNNGTRLPVLVGKLTELCDAFGQRRQLEEWKMVFDVMTREVGSGIGSFGGHWYTCPNGHIYTIGECGGAMETSTCPECGSTIGGRGHLLDPSNQTASAFLQTVSGPIPSADWRQAAATHLNHHI